MKSKNMLATNARLEPRQNEDFYATNPHALEIFLESLKKDNINLSKNVWECACGQGHLAKVLENKGYIVDKTDIVDRGYFGTKIQNFLNSTNNYNGTILTNPPFVFAEEFVRKGMEILTNNNLLVLFLKVQFLESKSRKKLFKEYPPKFVYINSERQHTAKDANFDKYRLATLCFCWFIWQKGYTGETIIRWI